MVIRQRRTAVQVQHLQSAEGGGNGGALVGFLVSLHLAQGQRLLGSLRLRRTDHVDGSLLAGPVIGTSGRLAVNGHHRAGQTTPRWPGSRTRSSSVRPRRTLGPAERRHCRRCRERGCRKAVPGRFGTRPVCSCRRVRYEPRSQRRRWWRKWRRRDWSKIRVHQFVMPGAFHSWVVQVGEMIENGCLGWLCHVLLPAKRSADQGTLAHF